MAVFITVHPGRQKPRWGFHPEEMNAGNGDRHGRGREANQGVARQLAPAGSTFTLGCRAKGRGWY